MVSTVFWSSIRLIQLLSNFFPIWLTLGWKVRKTRRAFEKEIISVGISKTEAKRLSKQIKLAKDKIMDSMWSSIK